MFNYYIGYDAREKDAYAVCSFSAQRKSTIPLLTHQLEHKDLRRRGLFSREWSVDAATGRMIDVRDGKPFSTEFAFTRFLVPHLCEYKGWALFTDCDVLWLDDIANLIAEKDDRFAVMVVQQTHVPASNVKMDNQPQAPYPRKNWSSVILFNNARCKNLTVDYVNTASGRDLHTFAWLKDEDIGELSPGWNFLVGHTSFKVKPRLMHFTDGGPWFSHLADIPYGGWWINEYNYMMRTQGVFE